MLDISDKAQPEAALPLGQLAALSRLHPHGAAAVRARACCRHRRVGGGRRRGLAEADLDPRRARRDQSGADLDLPAAAVRCLRAAAAGASARTTSTRTCRCRPRGTPTTIIIGTFFNGGLRAYDISNPYQPKEVGTFVPPAPPLAPRGTIQLNDVFVDERAIVYTVDRFVGGLYILEMDF